MEKKLETLDKVASLMATVGLVLTILALALAIMIRGIDQVRDDPEETPEGKPDDSTPDGADQPD